MGHPPGLLGARAQQPHELPRCWPRRPSAAPRRTGRGGGRGARGPAYPSSRPRRRCGSQAVEAGKDVEGVGSGDDALLEWLIACWGTDWGPGETHRPWTPGRPPRMRPRGLTMAKKVAKVSVIGDTAGEKKRLAADPQVLTISQLRIPVAVPQNPRIFADWVVRHGPWGAFRRVSSRSLAAP